MTLQDKLASMIQDAGLPNDTGKSHDDHLFTPLKLRALSTTSESFSCHVDTLYKETVGGRTDGAAEALRRHWEYMLLNLARVTFMRRWLAVSLTKNAYANDYWLKKYGLSYACMKVITDYLKESGLAEIRPGKKYLKNPKRTRVFPNELFQKQLIQYFLDSEQPIEPPYVSINGDSDSDWFMTIVSLPADHSDMAGMLEINEFLKSHQWACKAPVRLVYKDDPFHAGRLITPFNSLPDRKIKIRINTLIDGQDICEVDFSANHLRMNLAILGKEDAGDSPYEDIAELAKGMERAKVKKFITVAMSASGENEAFSALKQDGFNKGTFIQLKDATLKRYPKLSLFSGFGVNAQSLEGQILKQVMLEGVKANIVGLPVHDAIAVAQSNESWAKEAMLRAWTEHVSPKGVRINTKVKVDYP